ncbi:MAG: transglutaminase domain-containing protein, partial [bacterium]|nr:transglutaminase domain-containing protein [bacterium]
HIAREAYELVLGRTEYRRLPKFKGAEFCYKNRYGECCDYSALFVALCRAAGVPARPVAGLWAQGPEKWHVWAEFMLPGGEWIPVDPQIGDQNPWSREQCFGSVDNRRVALCRAFDIRLSDCKEGKTEGSLLQSGVFWWWTLARSNGLRQPQVVFDVTSTPVASNLPRPPVNR